MTKITLDNEYRALESLIEGKYPTLKVLSYNPVEPEVNDVAFELIASSTDEKNRAVTEKLRTYQLLFYFDKTTTAMTYHSNIDSLLEETSSIPCQDRFIKVLSHSMSRVFATTGGKQAFYCIVEARYHSGRTFGQVPKMQEIIYKMNGIETKIN